VCALEKALYRLICGGGALKAAKHASVGFAFAISALLFALPAEGEAAAQAPAEGEAMERPIVEVTVAPDGITGTTSAPDACIVEAASQTGTTTISVLPCGITLNGRTHDPPLPWNFAVGTHKVTWSWMDNNVPLTATQSIIVIDRSSPKITPPLTGVIKATENPATIPQATIDKVTMDSDDRPPKDLKPTITHSPASFTLGVHKVTWTATDGAGRQSTATQWIEVKDGVKPTIARCPPDLEVQSKVPVSTDAIELGTITRNDARDNLTPFENLKIKNNEGEMTGASKKYALGITDITWTVTDADDNSETCTQQVHVLPLSVLATFPSNAGATEVEFGASLASYGKLLFVGNPEHTHTPTDGSAAKEESGEVVAYLLEEDGGKEQYSLKKAIRPETPADNLGFGTSLAILSRPGDDVLAVGAPGYDNYSGSVHLYNAKTLAHTKTITNPNEGNSDHFGASLAAMGDKLVVSAHMYDGAGTNVGRVYVYDSSGAMYKLENPAITPDYSGSANKFGVKIAASDDGTTERIYVSSGSDGTVTGVVYIYDATSATSTTAPTRTGTAQSPSGTEVTDYGLGQIRAAGDGGVFVGETFILPPDSFEWEGKIHKHSPTGAKSDTIDPQKMNCKLSFGSAFDVGDDLLYAAHYGFDSLCPLVAFDSTTGANLGMFDSYPAHALPTGDFGSVVEAIGEGKVAVTETLESSDRLTQKTRVHLLDLRAIDGIKPAAQTSGPSPAQGAGTMSQAQAQAPRQAEPQISKVLAAPVLLSTERVDPSGVRLTYNVAISPFEVDIGDYMMSDRGLEIIDVDVSGSTVTLTYVGDAPGGADTDPPGVKLVGRIGRY